MQDLQDLLARLLVRQVGAPIVAAEVLQQPIVRARLVEVIEAAEALLDVPRMMRQELVEREQPVLVAVGVDQHGAVL